MAQVAAVALLIDYVVTVAVQTAAGSAAVVSAFPALSRIPGAGPKILLVISVMAIGVMCLGNLRGAREAGRVFAVPTYLFAGSVLAMIVAGLAREATGTLPRAVPGTGAVGIGTHSGLLAVGALYVMAKAFANGGSSLTGIEAVSNAVSALPPPQARHARQILTIQGATVAVLIAGISWLVHATHAIPYTTGFPTVLAQEARIVFGPTAAGQLAFLLLQTATAAVLFTGGNASFTGFPFLASFVAEDSFLPRWLTRRGHRLAFSNGIIVLTVLSVSLMLVAGATVDALIPFYAIGVFTGFAMAGFGMARYHAGADPIGSLRHAGHATVEGRLHTAQTRAGKPEGRTVLACEIADSTGELTVVFYGRGHIAGLEPGSRVRLRGTVGTGPDGRPLMANPAYKLLL